MRLKGQQNGSKMLSGEECTCWEGVVRIQVIFHILIDFGLDFFLYLKLKWQLNSIELNLNWMSLLTLLNPFRSSESLILDILSSFFYNWLFHRSFRFRCKVLFVLGAHQFEHTLSSFASYVLAIFILILMSCSVSLHAHRMFTTVSLVLEKGQSVISRFSMI
jgi:hypothetical protein